MGRWGDWENFYFSVLPSSFFLLPSSFFLLSFTSVTSALANPLPNFLLTNSRARHSGVQWSLQVGDWEQRVQAKQEECPDLPQSC
jgi:hypothetical protein